MGVKDFDVYRCRDCHTLQALQKDYCRMCGGRNLVEADFPELLADDSDHKILFQVND